MKLFLPFHLLGFMMCSLALAQIESGERFEEDLSDPILVSEQWLQTKPGEVYHGYLKLNSSWNNNWPLCWQLTGDHINLKKLSESWFRKNYLQSSPKSRIHDPQSYLSEVERDRLKDILKNHEQVSQLPIYLFILGADQQLIDMDAAKAGEQYLEKPNSALMFYFMNEPKATTGFVKTVKTPLITGIDKEDEEDETPLLDPFLVKTMFTKAGIHAAGMNLDKSETLYTTVTEVSRRMYWIEDELGLGPGPGPGPGPGSGSGSGSGFVTPSENVVKEKLVNVDELEDEPSVINKLWVLLGGNKENLLYLGSGILIAIFFIIAAIALMIHRRIKFYQFPNYSGPPRLKAKYGAGVSEVIAFKDARVSLSDQKKRIEDGELGSKLI